MGIYFYWNWHTNKKKETSAIKLKEQQLAELFQKIESRIPVHEQPPNEYEKIIVKDRLELDRL